MLHMNDLKLSLTSAIIWCNEKLDWKNLGACHRSAELFPAPVENSEDSNVTYLEFARVQALLNQVVRKRNELIANNIKLLAPGGRVLCFYPEYSLNDAMVAHECQVQIDKIHSDTNGEYIDDFDNPPWDTWLYCELNNGVIALYSWVHPELVEFVSNAIAADAYGCLVWAEELERQLNLKM